MQQNFLINSQKLISATYPTIILIFEDEFNWRTPSLSELTRIKYHRG